MLDTSAFSKATYIITTKFVEDPDLHPDFRFGSKVVIAAIKTSSKVDNSTSNSYDTVL